MPEFLVYAGLVFQKLVVGAVLDDVAVFYHYGSVHGSDSGETVSDGDDCLVFHQVLQCFLDLAFTLAVQGACRFVQNKNWSVFEYGSSYSYSLPLTTG